MDPVFADLVALDWEDRLPSRSGLDPVMMVDWTTPHPVPMGRHTMNRCFFRRLSARLHTTIDLCG